MVGEFRVETEGVRSVANLVEGANSSAATAAGELSSMSLSPMAFGQFGNAVGSASQSLQQQWGQSLTRMLDLLTKINGDVRTAATGYDTADADVATGYGGNPDGTAQQAAAGTAPTPPAHGTPQQNADWWAKLSPAERAAAIADPANRIGNLDGIPAAARSAANMHALPGMEQGLQQQIDQLKAQPHPDSGDIKELTGKRDALHALGEKVTGSAGLPADQRYYLLGADPADAGRAIIAKGDPDTATHVATFVPGIFSNLGNVPDSLLPKAEAMWSAAGGNTTHTSVIAWQGYTSPPHLVPDAMQTHFADDAKGPLDQFQQGLRVTHQGAPSYNVAIGHSYGSTVIGHAARDGDIAADALAFVGSPGVGVDHAAQLHVPADHVYATEAQHDIIRSANPGHFDVFHGPDPTGSDFGGHVFAAAPGSKGFLGGESVAAHSEYWKAGNPSLINLGLIINGQEPTAR